jgi:hypothetical protein
MVLQYFLLCKLCIKRTSYLSLITSAVVTGRILAPKKKEVTRRWRKFYKELHNVYSLPNIIRMIN